MSEEEKQDSQKTVVAFIAGLLIGGLLVWVFSGTPATEQTNSASDDDTQGEVSDNSGNTKTNSTLKATDETTDSTSNETPAETTLPELPVGDASVEVNNQDAGSVVELSAATFPTDEGWIGVRDYVDGQLTGLLGVARYSKEQGLIPETIVLQRATIAGNTYAIVFYSENGDRQFNLAEDVQMGGVMSTFQAQ